MKLPRLPAFIFWLSYVSVQFSGCAEQLMPAATINKPAPMSGYTVVVQVLPDYSNGEIMDAAQSTGSFSQMEIIDMSPQPFTIKTLRFRYELAQGKDMVKVHQRLCHCRGIVSASISNE